MKRFSDSFDAAPALPVYVPICSNHVTMATRMCSTLVAMCSEPISIHFLDDGSLTQEDSEILNSSSDVSQVICREEIQECVLPSLKRLRHAAKFFDEDCLGTKLLAPGIVASEDAFLICDSDMLFVTPFNGFSEAVRPFSLVFMREWRDTYSIVFRHRYLRRKPLRLPEGCNSGLLYCRKSVVDYEYLNWYLSKEQFRRWPWLVEQTGWGLLAGRTNAAQWNPKQVKLPSEHSEVEPKETIALHFYSKLRHRYDGWTVVSEHRKHQDLTCEPASYLRFAEAVKRRVVARLPSRFAKKN